MKILFISLISLIIFSNIYAQTNDKQKAREIPVDSMDSKMLKNFENRDIPFEYPTSASVDIPEGLKKYLNKIVEYMKEYPGAVLGITGHSDDQGKMKENHERSLKRAQLVSDYMISKGIPSSRLLPVGKGSIEPIASNKTEEGRRKNRRVEIRIVPSANMKRR